MSSNRNVGRGKFIKSLLDAAKGDKRPEAISDRIAMLSIDRDTVPVPAAEAARGGGYRSLRTHSNMIRLHFDESKPVFMYSVQFSPDLTSNPLRNTLLMKFRDRLPELRVFDGSSLYTGAALTKDLLNKQLQAPTNNDTDIEILIKFVKADRFERFPSLVNLIFKKILRYLDLQRIGKNFFNPRLCEPIPKQNLQIWPGFTTAIRSYDGGMFLCVDSQHRLLRSDTVLDVMFGLQGEPGDFVSNCVRRLVGGSVITRYNNRMYRIDDIDFKSSPQSTFMFKGRPTTYVDYYRDTYGLTIKDLKQPLLVHKKKSKVVLTKKVTVPTDKFLITNDQLKDEPEELAMLVPELTCMTGLTDDMRKDYTLMRDISRFIHAGPRERFACLKKFLSNLHANKEAMNELLAWGIHFDDKFCRSEAKQLPDEKLLIENGKSQFQVDPRTGWVSQISNKRLYSIVNINHWAVLCLGRDKLSVQSYVHALIENGRRMFMEIAMPTIHEIAADKNDQYVSSLKAVTQNRALQMVMVFMSAQRADRYSAIKKICYCGDRPIACQVMLTRTIANPKKVHSVAQRVAMQMNCKLGGELWAVHIPLNSVMAIGIDVNHASLTMSGKKASVVGFVSSMSSTFTKWYSTTLFQDANNEMVGGIRKCLLKALEKYQRHNDNALPQTIVVFRDGVGSGQIGALFAYEIDSFFSSFAELGDYRPSLIFTIIRKRISLRLFFEDEEGGVANPVPGTVVDDTITDHLTLDAVVEKGMRSEAEHMRHYYSKVERSGAPSFYIVSQHFSQGTVQPTCFSVLYNNSKLTLAQIQRLAYKCTYLYYNWPGTVRVPAPCQYAHKLCYMVGQYLHKEANPELADKLFYL